MFDNGNTEESQEQKKAQRYRMRMQKATHLADRVKNFLHDIDKSTLKHSEKQAIRERLLSFLK